MNRLLVPVMAIVLGVGSVAFATITDQAWYFSDNVAMPAPDVLDNPYGTPQLKVTPGPGGWIATDADRTGIWSLSGEIDIIIPNRPIVDGYKKIWIELAWKPGDLDPFLPDVPLVGAVSDPQFDKLEMTSLNVATSPNGWVDSKYEITIWPNPRKEWIAIKGDILVDKLLIRTECIPEPATIGLLGLGALALLRVHRKH